MNRQTRRRLAREIPIIRAPKKSEIDIVTDNSSVIIKFPEAVSNAKFTPDQALSLAEILVKLAMKIKGVTK